MMMSLPLMDTMQSAVFRLSMDELVDLERKKRCGISRKEVLSNIYCPAVTLTPTKFLYSYLPSERQQSNHLSKEQKSRMYHLSLLSSASAVCVDGSVSSSFWSNNNYCHIVPQKRLDLKKEEAVRGVLEKVVASSFRHKDPTYAVPLQNRAACHESKHRNFIVVNHGYPIDPDYNILSEAKHLEEDTALLMNIMAKEQLGPDLSRGPSQPASASSLPYRLTLDDFSADLMYEDESKRPKSASCLDVKPSSNIRIMKRKSILRKKSSVGVGPMTQNCRQDSSASRHTTDMDAFITELDNTNSNTSVTLAVSPRFNWKPVDTTPSSHKVNEEQLLRQLVTLHRAISHKDKDLLRHVVRRNEQLDLTVPLRGVTALSLTVYLKQNDMTSELLSILRRTKQLNRAIDMCSVDNASRREPPIVTAARTGQMEIIRLLSTHGANLEARDGQGRTALWHAVREEQDAIVAHLVKAGAKVFYRNEDLSCPLQLACKTALLKHKGRQMVKLLVQHGANIEFVDHALRNALYWSVYNCCSEISIFLLEAGARVKPWSWLQDDALPESFLQNKQVHTIVQRARKLPPTLFVLARLRLRMWLSDKSWGTSILPLIDRLKLDDEMRSALLLEKPLHQVSLNKAVSCARKKLQKLCTETKV